MSGASIRSSANVRSLGCDGYHQPTCLCSGEGAAFALLNRSRKRSLQLAPACNSQRIDLDKAPRTPHLHAPRCWPIRLPASGMQARSSLRSKMRIACTSSARFPRPVRVATCPLILLAGGPGLVVRRIFLRNAQRFGERDNSQDKERDAGAEDGHSAAPPGEGTPILFRPVATERPAVHVFGLRGLASATVFTRARRGQM